MKKRGEWLKESTILTIYKHYFYIALYNKYKLYKKWGGFEKLESYSRKHENQSAKEIYYCYSLCHLSAELYLYCLDVIILC